MQCASCPSPASWQCGQCRSAFYCSRFCQRADWAEHLCGKRPRDVVDDAEAARKRARTNAMAQYTTLRRQHLMHTIDDAGWLNADTTPVAELAPQSALEWALALEAHFLPTAFDRFVPPLLVPGEEEEEDDAADQAYRQLLWFYSMYTPEAPAGSMQLAYDYGVTLALRRLQPGLDTLDDRDDHDVAVAGAQPRLGALAWLQQDWTHRHVRVVTTDVEPWHTRLATMGAAALPFNAKRPERWADVRDTLGTWLREYMHRVCPPQLTTLLVGAHVGRALYYDVMVWPGNGTPKQWWYGMVVRHSGPPAVDAEESSHGGSEMSTGDEDDDA